jgi:hypothetical protein
MTLSFALAMVLLLYWFEHIEMAGIWYHSDLARLAGGVIPFMRKYSIIWP